MQKRAEAAPGVTEEQLDDAVRNPPRHSSHTPHTKQMVIIVRLLILISHMLAPSPLGHSCINHAFACTVWRFQLDAPDPKTALIALVMAAELPRPPPAPLPGGGGGAQTGTLAGQAGLLTGSLSGWLTGAEAPKASLAAPSKPAVYP